MRRDHTWFTSAVTDLWVSRPGESVLCLMPFGSDTEIMALIEQWVPVNFRTPATSENLSPLLLNVVPDQATSASKFMARLFRQVKSRTNLDLDFDPNLDVSELLSDLVDELHSSGFHPILLIDRFHSFARIADHATVSLLSQLRTLECRWAVTTVAISSQSYGNIRRSIPADMAFVNSSYGSNHKTIALSPLTFAEFCTGRREDPSILSRLYEMGTGPDSVYRALLDDFDFGSVTEENCLQKVGDDIRRLVSDASDSEDEVYKLLGKVSAGALSKVEASYALALPFWRFVVNVGAGGDMHLRGTIMARFLAARTVGIELSSIERKFTLLFVSANPGLDLDLESEYKVIEAAFRISKHRDDIKFIFASAANPETFIASLREHKPSMVHFSGHGSKDGIWLRGSQESSLFIGSAVLRCALEGRGVDLVLLNSCESNMVGHEIISSVKTVISTSQTFGDDAGIKFSETFYRTFLDGYTVAEALRDAKDALSCYGLNNVHEALGPLDFRLSATAVN